MATQPADAGGARPAAPASGATTRAARATALTILLVLLSRVLGIAREWVLAHYFGQNDVTDIYRRAFAVPDLIALVAAGGALSSVFIPVFSEFWGEREKDAWKMFGTVTTLVATAVAALAAILFAAAPLFAHLTNPTFTPDDIARVVPLTRILLPAQWCILVGGLIIGTLYARDRFLVPGLAPIIYNLGTIFGAVLFHNTGIESLAWGTLAGAIVGHFLLPTIEAIRLGTPFYPGFDLKHPGVVKVGKLMIPVLLGLSLSQLNMWITGMFLPADKLGRISALTNAYTLTQAPIGIFAQAFAIVLFPTISALAAKKDWLAFRSEISQGIRSVLFLTIPASVWMAVLAVPLVRLIFLGPRFGEAQVERAAAALLFYSVGTFAWSAQAVVARGFYAKQDTWTPIYITTPMVAVFIGACFALKSTMGYLGLALAASLVGTLTLVLLLFFLQKSVGGLNLRAIASSTLRIGIAAALSGGAAWLILRTLSAALAPTKGNAALTALVAGENALIVYVIACFLLRVPELQTARALLSRKRRTT